MKQKKPSSKAIGDARSIAEASSDDGLFSTLSVADQVDISCFARDACGRLPNEDEVARQCRDERASPLIIEGSRLIRFMAGEFGQPEADELHVAYIRFIQVEAMLTVVGSDTQKSCIGEAQDRKKKCQEDCKKSKEKFCGCFWNSFLEKTNCFVSVNVGIPS